MRGYLTIFDFSDVAKLKRFAENARSHSSYLDDKLEDARDYVARHNIKDGVIQMAKEDFEVAAFKLVQDALIMNVRMLGDWDGSNDVRNEILALLDRRAKKQGIEHIPSDLLTRTPAHLSWHVPR